MNWIFWAVLAVTIVLMAAPLYSALTPDAQLTFWLIGSLLFVALVLWVVATFSTKRTPAHATASAPPR